MVAKAVPCQEDQLKEAFLISGALLRVDCRNPRWHLLYVDTLLAKGKLSSEHAISFERVEVKRFLKPNLALTLPWA